MKANNAAFLRALEATGPSGELAGAGHLYDRVLGSWALEAIDHDLPGGRRTASGEVHFGWVLEGRAIQDVWIIPRRGERAGAGKQGNRYGTTLRVFDPVSGAWSVTWINPVSRVTCQLSARERDGDIVQHGERADGTRIRWTFTAITPRSFHWLGEASRDRGQSWTLETEFFATRIDAEA